MPKRNREIIKGENKVLCQYWLEIEGDGYMRPYDMVSLHVSKECLVKFIEEKLKRDRHSPDYEMPMGDEFEIGVSDQTLGEINEAGGSSWYEDTVSGGN